MNKEIIKDWLSDIATPTGISYSGDQTISESMAENIVNYVDELEQQCKKQKEVIDKAIDNIDLVIELIKQQPTEDDSWILSRLNAFKIILKEEK